MDIQKQSGEIGFIITKAPLENSYISKLLESALNAINKNKKIGFFLISDGVYLIKKNQKNIPFNLIKKIIAQKTEIIVSIDHLNAAGISKDELLNEIKITEKTYDELVEFIMEKYERVITI